MDDAEKRLLLEQAAQYAHGFGFAATAVLGTLLVQLVHAGALRADAAREVIDGAEMSLRAMPEGHQAAPLLLASLRQVFERGISGSRTH